MNVEPRHVRSLVAHHKALALGDAARSRGFLFGASYAVLHGLDAATLDLGVVASRHQARTLGLVGLDAAEFTVGARLALCDLLGVGA